MVILGRLLLSLAVVLVLKSLISLTMYGVSHLAKIDNHQADEALAKGLALTTGISVFIGLNPIDSVEPWLFMAIVSVPVLAHYILNTRRTARNKIVKGRARSARPYINRRP